MFGLIKGFYDHYFSKPTYNILIIGIDNSGKTVFLFFVLWFGTCRVFLIC